MFKTLSFLLVLWGACAPHAEVSQAEPLPAAGIVSNQFETSWAPSGKASIAEFARGENAFLGRLWLAPGAAVPEHQDPTEEFLYILSGKGVLTLNGITHAVGPGHVIYMPAKATVSFNNGDQPLEAIQVFADPTSANKYQKWGPKPL